MKSACFTGHRTLSGDISHLEEQLHTALEDGIANDGIIDFYCGAALGWDILCAKMILKLREDYPQIRLHMILPCPPQEQTARWSEEQRLEYMEILDAANDSEQTSLRYFDGCMKIRNARLVELADCCFCYWNPHRKRSGTAQTVRMAQKKGITVVNFFYAT